MASIKDVARRANVGVGTVSRTINGTGYVSEETRKRIEKAMEELDYTPNELARNLYFKKTGIVGVIVPDASHPFFAEFVKNVESFLYDKGYKMMLCNTVRNQNYEKEYLDMLNRHIVDGVISGCHTLEVEEYARIKKPIVALDRYLGKYIPLVVSDHKKGGQLAAKILLEAGCRCVMQFVGNLALDSPYQERHKAFSRIMLNSGVKVFSYELEWNRFDNTYFEEVVQHMFDVHPEVDGVFGVDMLAAGYVREALRKGKRVPEDVKIVAYDGTYIVDIITPKLTCIVQQIGDLAESCVKLVTDMIVGKEYTNKEIIIDVKIKKGETA
jgi:LacI family sucrose operon transcriptional repressor